MTLGLMTMRTTKGNPSQARGGQRAQRPQPKHGGLHTPSDDGSRSASVSQRSFGVPIAIPATIDLQLSPTNKIDAGLQFSFPNLKPPGDPAPKFYDNRFLLLFAQLRI